MELKLDDDHILYIEKGAILVLCVWCIFYFALGFFEINAPIWLNITFIISEILLIFYNIYINDDNLLKFIFTIEMWSNNKNY